MSYYAHSIEIIAQGVKDQYIAFKHLKFLFHCTQPKHTRELAFNSVTFSPLNIFQGDDQTNKIELQLEQLRLSSVEREFRKRIAEYNTGNGINGNGDSGSVRYIH